MSTISLLQKPLYKLLLLLVCSPLDNAENVHPKQTAGSNVDHSELLGDKDEVDRLSGHPEAAGGLEGGHQLVLALLQQVRLPLHQRHRDIEGGQDGRRDQKLVKKQLFCQGPRCSSNIS